MPFSMAPDFGAVSAIAHVAPAAAVVFAAVEEQPAAIACGALMDFGNSSFANEKFCGRASDGSQEMFGFKALLGPLPVETFAIVCPTDSEPAQRGG